MNHSNYFPNLKTFSESYRLDVHIPLCICICALGMVANIMNIVVLTRKTMIGATNVLLTGLSASQLSLLLAYLYQLTHDLTMQNCVLDASRKSYMAIKLFCVNLSIVFHTSAVVLMVILTLYRTIAVQYPTHLRQLSTIPVALKIVASVFILVPLLCIPIYFGSTIESTDLTTWNDYYGCNFTKSSFVSYELAYEETIMGVAMWVLGIVFKILPCILIITLSIRLIMSLAEVQKRKKSLLNKSNGGVTNSITEAKKAKATQQRNRVTIMLVAIASLFTTVELPHGILVVLAGSKDPQFMELYSHLGDLINMLTLLYSSVNFVLCCAMSELFRTTFTRIFCPPKCQKLVMSCAACCNPGLDDRNLPKRAATNVNSPEIVRMRTRSNTPVKSNHLAEALPSTELELLDPLIVPEQQKIELDTNDVEGDSTNDKTNDIVYV